MSAPLPAALSWMSANGVMMATGAGAYTMVHAPFALHPTKFPRALFDLGYQLAAPYNALYDAVSRDRDFLLAILAPAAAADEFTGKMLALYRDVLKREEERGSPVQPITLGIHRSDYMMHEECAQCLLQQVEFNTISASFACLSSRVTALHRFLRGRYEAGAPVDALPLNDTLTQLPAAIATAHRLYGAPAAVVLFVVQAGETNVMDQRLLEFALWDSHAIPVVRLSLLEVLAAAQVREGDALWLPSSALPPGVSSVDVEVSVAYFRSGYTPNDYTTGAEWEARALIEHSKAVKCPNIAYHLAGTKKVQQALALPGAVERYLSAEDSALVRRSFTGLWGLGKEEPQRDEIIAAAIADPASYVLKPQREGGGNNIYGEAVKTALSTMSDAELEAFILMKRIFPPSQTSELVRKGVAITAATVSEFGVYGVFVSDGAKVVLNAPGGHLLRTKTIDSDEGGVAAGFAVLDSPDTA